MKQTGMVNELFIQEAARLGDEYTRISGSCSVAVFDAVMEVLGYGDDPVAREIGRASIGLTGGTGCMAIGTCGALAGAAMAVSYSFGFGRKDIEDNMACMFAVNNAVSEIGRRMQEMYGHIQCQEVQFALWGKSFRFSNPDVLAEFAAFSMDEQSGFKCSKLSGAVSGWAVECILKHNPNFCRTRHN